MSLVAGRYYEAIPQGYLLSNSGDIRPVYSTACPADGNYRLSVPQGILLNNSGDKRAINATADCVDGQSLGGVYVRAVPQGVLLDIGGDKRPLYAMTCCPGGSSSSSSGIFNICCDPISVPATLHINISGSGSCGIDGTYPLTFSVNQWTYGPDVNNLSIQFFCNVFVPSQPACGFSLVISASVLGSLCYQVSTCGSSSGLWISSSASCSPFYLQSNPTNYNSVTCGCTGGTATFTVTA